MENRKTLLAVTTHPLRRAAAFGISAKQLATKLLSFNKTLDQAHPDTQALRFYSLNQIIALMGAKFTPNEVLPAWGEKAVELYCKELDSQHSRMFWYTFLVVSREWRHLKNLSTVSNVKSQPYTPELKKLHPVISDSNSEEHLNKWLSKVPAMSLSDYCKAITHSFNVGSWSGGYGGKAWGCISQTLLNYIDGKISGEVFIDTAYTLAHNNGPMFNKGMLYSGYSSEFKAILDVQRSGQVCEAIWSGEFCQSSATDDIRSILLDCRSELGIGEYVDWYKVESLGSLQQYPHKKDKQDKLYGKKETLVAGKPVKVKTVFEWYPGKTVEVFEREGVV
jgi:hypothetical protein